LTDASGTLYVGVNGAVLDTVSWGSPEQPKSGVARNLTPNATDPLANDIAENWCHATAPYGLGDKGTPGGPNEECIGR
jgi:hypothetical protein